MQIEIPENPNCSACDQAIFSELESPRPIRGIRVSMNGQDVDCEIKGVSDKGDWSQVFACKVADSGEGTAFLIYGGVWGIRIRPSMYAKESWDLSNKHQWGEPYKIYGSENDILFE